MSAGARTREWSDAAAPYDGLPRLLRGVTDSSAMTLGEHLEVHGPLPAPRRGRARSEVIELVEQAGLRGRGGAAFPTARKMRAVATSRRRPVVLVNAVEAEPASAKDRTLLAGAPHLVLDGAVLAAGALGAEEVILGVSASLPSADVDLVFRAVAERADEERRGSRVAVRQVPHRYVAGHESALVNALNGREAIPSFIPPAPYERGVGGAPTLVSNAETYAHLALICRFGPRWFRELGTPAHPGSALVTVSGAVANPGVYEIGIGLELRELLRACALSTASPRAVLLGGYGGTWVAGESDDLRLCNHALSGYGATVGAGVIVVLDDQSCPVAETLRIVGHLAAESAGQCGPCVHGLSAIASELADVASGNCASPPTRELERLSALVRGRGACSLPDGVDSLVVSAIDVFGEELAEHAREGPCEACLATAAPPVADLR